MKEPITRFLNSRHWDRILRCHSPKGKAGGVWIDDISSNLASTLAETWESLEPGDFIGGPSWGCGSLADERFAVDTRSAIENFFTKQSDASERFTGNESHPCWMAFKKEASAENILILSGCDERQMTLFGKLSRANHELYAEKHGYQTRWMIWDRDGWDWSRGTLVWAKLQAMADVLAEGVWDQVWWVDADAVFLNMEKRIDGFLHTRWDAAFPEFERDDRVMLSTGIFGCRPPAGPLLRHVWKMGGEEEETCEEATLTEAVYRRPDLWKKVHLVEHSVFNGFYGWNVHFTDPARNFICHLVGRSNLERRRVFTEVNRFFGI